LIIGIGYDKGFRIILHDPFFFAINENPISFPSLSLEIYPNKSERHYYHLTMTEMEELDLPEDPCNLDRNYNFQACVKEGLSRQVGCRTNWDRWTNSNWPICTTIDQFR
jgi:hypothetical protein